MAVKPEKYPRWGYEDLVRVIQVDGDPVVIRSKQQPTDEFELSGLLFGEPLPRQYVNFQFDRLDEWTQHLDQRYGGGDIKLTVGGSASEVSERMGSEHTSRGSALLGSITTQVWEDTEN